MTAPDTNLKKQAKRHRGPLIGMIIAVAIALSALVWMLSSNVTGDSETPAGSTAPAEATGDAAAGRPAAGDVSGPSSTGAPQVIETSPSPAD